MNNRKKIPFPVALIPIVVVGGMLFYTILQYEAEPHPSLMVGIMLAALIGVIYGWPWKDIRESLVKNIQEGISAVMILLIIGMLIGTWTASGVVPGIMLVGFQVFHPSWFLPMLLVVCAVVSVLTGSSWTTAGTIGVASMGIGQGLGIPGPMVAGAIVSGAFFGDKLSPLSDSTNLTPSLLDVNLYEHIKHMLYTTLPSFLIALGLYTGMSIWALDVEEGMLEIGEYQEAIGEAFHITPVLVIPPIVIILLVIFKVPAIPGLFLGALAGGILQIAVQGETFGEVVHTLYAGVEVSTGWSEMDELLSGGGMSSMYSVVVLAVLALGFGGLLNDLGILKGIIGKFLFALKNQGGVVAATVFTSIFINIFGANQYLSVVLPGQMYEKYYEKLGLHNKNLTRALEAGGTLTSPLVPWNSSGAFMYSVLGISPFLYAPYAFVSWLTFILVIIFAVFNVKMAKIKNSDG